jgi:hypothetical protein
LVLLSKREGFDLGFSLVNCFGGLFFILVSTASFSKVYVGLGLEFGGFKKRIVVGLNVFRVRGKVAVD